MPTETPSKEACSGDDNAAAADAAAKPCSAREEEQTPTSHQPWWLRIQSAVMVPFLKSAPRSRRVIAILAVSILVCVAIVAGTTTRRPRGGDADVLSYVDPLIGTTNGGKSPPCSHYVMRFTRGPYLPTNLRRPCISRRNIAVW